MLESLKSMFVDNQTGIYVAVITGVFTSLVATGMVFLIGKAKIYRHDKRYKKNNGKYIAYRKYDDSRKEPVLNLGIVAKANTLEVRGSDIKNNEPIKGEILFERSIPNYGTGYYTHGNGWGFFQVQIKSDSIILAHMPYHDGGNEIHQAYVLVKTTT